MTQASIAITSILHEDLETFLSSIDKLYKKKKTLDELLIMQLKVNAKRYKDILSIYQYIHSYKKNVYLYDLIVLQRHQLLLYVIKPNLYIQKYFTRSKINLDVKC